MTADASKSKTTAAVLSPKMGKGKALGLDQQMLRMTESEG